MTNHGSYIPGASHRIQQTPLLCEKCAYQLIGMDREGHCPECRHPVALSRKAWIAEESVAGIATQTLGGVCGFILARNLSLYAMILFAFSWWGLFFLIAIICEAVTAISMRGAMSVAFTPSLLRKHGWIQYADTLWCVVVSWPIIAVLMLIATLIQRTGTAALIIAAVYFLTRSIVWSVLFFGLHHRIKAHHNHTAQQVFIWAVGVALLTPAVLAFVILQGHYAVLSGYTSTKLAIHVFLLGTTVSSALTCAAAWLVSKPAWEAELES